MISMIEGGLAEVTTTQSGDGRRSLKVGNTRLLDIIGSGADMVIECKGSKRDPVRANPKDVLRVLDRMVTESERKVI